MESFYIVLPSNSPVEGNTSSKFTVRLPETLDLDTNWTVALSSIIYPHSFTTLGSEEQQYIDVFFEDNKFERVNIPSVVFTSVSLLEKTLNHALQEHFRLALERQGSHARKKRSTQLPEEGQLKEPERVQESAETTAAIEALKIKKEEDRKLQAAKNATERVLRQIIAISEDIERMAERAQAIRHESELMRRKFPSGTEELYVELRSIVQQIQDKNVEITEEAKKAADAKNKVSEYFNSRNVRDARITADIAKNIHQRVKDLANEAGVLFAGTPEKNYQNSVTELRNRIKSIIKITVDADKPDEEVQIPENPPAEPEGVPETIPPSGGQPEVSRIPERVEESSEIKKAVEELQKAKERAKQQGEPAPEIQESIQSQVEEPPSEVPERIEESSEILQAVDELQKSKTKEQEKHDPEIIVPKKPSPENVKEKIPEIPTLQKSTDEDRTFKVVEKEKIPEKKKSKVSTLIIADADRGTKVLSPLNVPSEKKKKISTDTSIKKIIRDGEISLPLLPTPMALTLQQEKEERLKMIDREYLVGDENKVRFVFDDIHQRFYTLYSIDVNWIELSKELTYVLGYRTQRVYRQYFADYMPDLTGGVKQLFVYAPKLVENTILGNVSAPLLRVVNISGEPGQIQESIYTSEFHQRLQARRISEINIEIRTATGELVKFNWGNTILTLHFKRSIF